MKDSVKFMQTLARVFVLDPATRSAAPPTPGAAIKSALGYFTVAAASTWAGYAVRHQHVFPQYEEIPGFVFFLAVLFPVYVNRAILYELRHIQLFGERDHNRVWLRILSVQLPAVLLAFGGLPAALLVWYTRHLTSDNLACTLERALIGALPLYVMGISLIRRWPSDPRIFNFRFRSFFPAFGTCLVPFAFGYANCADMSWFIGTAALVLIYWFVSLHLRIPAIVVFGSLLLIALAAGQIIGVDSTLPIARWAQVLFFGTAMTLAMGVSESWRITGRILNDHDIRFSTPYTSEDKQFYLGGTNLATALFLPLFLTTFLHPSTSSLYGTLLLCLLAVQYLAWIYITARSKWKFWPAIGVLFGLMIPVIISFGARFGHAIELAAFEPLPREVGGIATVLALDISMCTILVGAAFKNASILPAEAKTSYVAYFLSPTLCICVTGILSFILSIFILLGNRFLHPRQLIETRMSELNYVYMFIGLLCCLFVGSIWIKRKMRRLRVRAKSLDHSNGEAVPPLDHLRAVLRITRITPSLIAGLLTGFIVYRGHVGTPQVAFRASVAMFLVTIVGFIADNIYDAPTDRLSGARNPLALGLLSKSSAIWSACLLSIGAMIISPGIYGSRVILAASIVGLLIYPFFGRRFPLFKGIYTALLVCAPLVYGMTIGGIYISIKYYLVLALFIVGREAFLDSYQWDADRRAGIITIAVKWGQNIVERLAAYIMVIASVLLIIIAEGQAARVIAVVCFLTVAVILYSPIKARFRPGLLRLSMLLGAIAIGLSA